MSASWYDVLGVDEHASPAEIRTAWKDSIADLGPGDRKFRVCNEAAEVLLDPERRAAYDAELGIAPAAELAEVTHENEADVADGADEGVTVAPSAEEPAGAGKPAKVARPLPAVPGWLIIGLAVAVLVVAGLAVWLPTSDADDQQVETAVDEATAAARTNVPLVLSYDYKNPEASRDRALQVLTGDLKTDYADLWEKALITNVKKAKAFAKSEVVNAGVACVSDDGRQVGVLVVVDATTGNVKQSDDLTVSFTATMEDVDGQWLVRDLDGWDPRALAGGGSEDSGSGSASPSDGSSSASPDAGGNASGATDCAAG